MSRSSSDFRSPSSNTRPALAKAGTAMDSALVGLVLFVLALVVLDLAALRFGVNTRPGPDDRPDW